jgi:hypothetical protein
VIEDTRRDPYVAMTSQSLADWSRSRARSSSIGARALFILAAFAFTYANYVMWVHVLDAAGVYAYIGVRVLERSPATLAVFWAIAVLPAFLLRVHLRRPSDVVQLFLYYAVHIPTAVLMPLVSYSAVADQLIYCVSIGIALIALDVRYLMPLVRVPALRVSPLLFWTGVAAFYVLAMLVFWRSGYLSFDNLDFVQVYAQREELADRASELGRLFFYMANWTGAAFAPFLIIAGLHRRRISLVVLGVIVATASFVVSSNKANYMAVPAVIVGYYVLRASQGRYLGAMMGGAFFALTAATILLDTTGVTGVSLPVVTFQLSHRLFTNNGYLSAIYLDLFNSHQFAYYADSFLRWLPGPRLASPVPVLAGASFTDVPNVWANANLWADGYANLGLIGIALTAAFTALVLWLYDSITSRKNLIFAASALVIPASALANTSTNVALVSNGMFLVFLLMHLWTGVDLLPADGRPRPQAIR